VHPTDALKDTTQYEAGTDMTCDGITSEAPRQTQHWPGLVEVAPDLFVSRVPEDRIDEILALTAAYIPGETAQAESLRRVHRRNSDSFWGAFARQPDGKLKLAGYQACLFLNRAGELALIAGTLDTKQPQEIYLTTKGERPAAIYIWCVVAERLSKIAGPAIIMQMADLHKRLPVYAIVVTEAGLRAARKMNYKPVRPGEEGLNALYLFDGFVPKTAAPEPKITVRVVAKADEHAKAMALRAAVFMSEQSCPYDEEFDDNDFCATHLLATVDGEPAATMRIRYFAEWVKLERLAVLPRFRKSGVKTEIINAAFELARRKGYRQCYGHSQKRLVSFWERYGFSVLDRNVQFAFSDHDYVEIARELDPHPDAVTMRSDPMVIIRPEGRWDEPGALDRSASRPVTRPH